MTTIKSFSGANELDIEVVGNEVDIDICGRRGSGGGIFGLTDLLAALGVDPLTDGQARTLRNTVAAAIASRNAAEKKLAEARANWEAECGNLENAMQRAEAAEATIQRVRETLAKVEPNAECEDSCAIVEALYTALDPAPAFTLPTVAGAEFYATRDGREERFITYTNGDTCLYEGRGGVTTAEDLRANWSKFRPDLLAEWEKELLNG